MELEICAYLGATAMNLATVNALSEGVVESGMAINKF